MKIICLDTVGSTNNWIAEHEQDLDSPVIVRSIVQNSGRGQRGNSWESEPGKNFTGSLLIRPVAFPASSQFYISEAAALAIIKTLEEYGIESRIKWPNDIYVGDKKICGILVEHSILGRNITRSIIGMGINLNQEVFISDAPNPVSMKMITGKDYDLDEFSGKLGENLEIFFRDGDAASMHERFLNKLWRHDGIYYQFKDKKTDEVIMAMIHSVASDGVLTLLTPAGEK